MNGYDCLKYTLAWTQDITHDSDVVRAKDRKLSMPGGADLLDALSVSDEVLTISEIILGKVPITWMTPVGPGLAARKQMQTIRRIVGGDWVADGWTPWMTMNYRKSPLTKRYQLIKGPEEVKCEAGQVTNQAPGCLVCKDMAAAGNPK